MYEIFASGLEATNNCNNPPQIKGEDRKYVLNRPSRTNHNSPVVSYI
jgi:hypothetical protein